MRHFKNIIALFLLTISAIHLLLSIAVTSFIRIFNENYNR